MPPSRADFGLVCYQAKCAKALLGYVLKQLTFETWIVETEKTFEHHTYEERLFSNPHHTPEGADKKCQANDSADENRYVFPRPFRFSEKLHEWIRDYSKKGKDA